MLWRESHAGLLLSDLQSYGVLWRGTSGNHTLLSNPAIAALLQQQRGKREVEGLIGKNEEDKMELMEDLLDFKAGMETKIGNLACVLTQMKMLDAAGDINIDLYSYQSLYGMLKDTPAGADVSFLRKMADGFSDCHDISRSWPQQSLDRKPITKKHGRHIIFFECAKKVEMKMCTKFQISQWLELLYGDYASANLGLPADKYDAAAMAIKAMYSATTDEEMFVDDFFWQSSKFM